MSGNSQHMRYCVVAGIRCGIHHIRGCRVAICIMRDTGDWQGRRTISTEYNPSISQQIPCGWDLYCPGQGRSQLTQIRDNDGRLLLARTSVVSYRRQRASGCAGTHAQGISIDIITVKEGFPSGLFRRVDARTSGTANTWPIGTFGGFAIREEIQHTLATDDFSCRIVG